jgi:D-arabinose 1-dehydrogenase-like Zn-dependent alcohol dehydrogenase
MIYLDIFPEMIGLGHLAIQYANKMGFRVAAISSSGEKRKIAMELGAHYYFDASQCDLETELLKLGGANVIMCNAPDGEAISKLFGGVARNGTILLLSSALPRGSRLQSVADSFVQWRRESSSILFLSF